MMHVRALAMWCAAACVALVVGRAAGEGRGDLSGGLGQAEVAPAAMSKRERLEQVVAELNARAVARADGGLSVTSGEMEAAQGEASSVAWNVNERGLGGGCSIDVALIHRDSEPGPSDVQAKLLADVRIASVTLIDGTVVTPTFSQLLAFDAVMVYTDGDLLDADALGNSLAAYVDSGGGVVVAQLALEEIGGFPSIDIGGRFLSDNYYCIERVVGDLDFSPGSMGTVNVPGHPVMAGVATFTAVSGFRPAGALHPRGTRVASWDSGELLVATRDDLAGRRVDLGFFPVSTTVQVNGWNAATDGGRLMRNAVVYASGCPGVGLEGCGASQLRFGPFVNTGSFNSNTAGNNNFYQQVADEFTFGSTTNIGRITLWGAYWGSEFVPPIAQRFVVNIHANAGGVPGAIVYTQTLNAEPVWVGDHNGELHRMYRFTLDLPEKFVASGGVTYWLIPLGDNNEFTWSWQGSSAGGTTLYQGSPGGPWIPTFDNLNRAFELCGFCECMCPGDGDFDGDVDLNDLQILLFYFGFSCL